MTLASQPSLAVDARMIAHSGIGTYLRNILAGLLASGTFRITMMGDRGTLEKYGLLEKADFLPLVSPIYRPQEQVELSFRVPACDVFWSPHFNVPLLPVRARRRLVTIHDAYHLAHPEAFGRLGRTYARLLFRGAVHRSDRIITVSEFSRKEIIRFAGGEEKLLVIPNGIDPNFAEGFERRPIGEDYVLFVGNVKPNKNLRTLLRAFALMAKDFPSLKLYVVGRTEGLLNPDNDVRSLIDALPEGRARLLGQVSQSDLKNYYANARLFAFPSRYEGFGLPLLEAMCFGLPIVSSKAGPMQEVGGEAVAYFDPNDAAEMARAMTAALRAPRPRREGAYAKQIGRFTWTRSSAAHHDVIADLAAGAGGGVGAGLERAHFLCC